MCKLDHWLHAVSPAAGTTHVFCQPGRLCTLSLPHHSSSFWCSMNVTSRQPRWQIPRGTSIYQHTLTTAWQFSPKLVFAAVLHNEKKIKESDEQACVLVYFAYPWTRCLSAHFWLWFVKARFLWSSGATSIPGCRGEWRNLSNRNKIYRWFFKASDVFHLWRRCTLKQSFYLPPWFENT